MPDIVVTQPELHHATGHNPLKFSASNDAPLKGRSIGPKSGTHFWVRCYNRTRPFRLPHGSRDHRQAHRPGDCVWHSRILHREGYETTETYAVKDPNVIVRETPGVTAVALRRGLRRHQDCSVIWAARRCLRKRAMTRDSKVSNPITIMAAGGGAATSRRGCPPASASR